MKNAVKTVCFFLAGCLGYLALICSIAASCITNEALMKEGFQNYSEARHLGVAASEYDIYAASVSKQLQGKTENAVIPDPENPGQTKNAFSDKENQHLSDVRKIVSLLTLMRYIGGGAVLMLLLGIYAFGREKRSALFLEVWRGFGWAAPAILLIGLALGIWGLINFKGLFWTFHQVAFTNDLWLLDPNQDLLVALMPIGFFSWYGGVLIRNLLPILGVMICVFLSWVRMGRKEMQKSH